MFTCSENLNFIELHQFSTNNCSFFSDPGEYLNKDSKCNMPKSPKYKRKKGRTFFFPCPRGQNPVSFFLYHKKKGAKGRKLLASYSNDSTTQARV